VSSDANETGRTTSTTVPGRETDPASVTNVEPGVPGLPAVLNHVDPNRTINATWA